MGNPQKTYWNSPKNNKTQWNENFIVSLLVYTSVVGCFNDLQLQNKRREVFIWSTTLTNLHKEFVLFLVYRIDLESIDNTEFKLREECFIWFNRRRQIYFLKGKKVWYLWKMELKETPHE